MKTSKSMYSRSFKEYILTPETIARLQEELLTILVDIKYVCDKYGIHYMLSGGTMLGAVRHKGFIPWDDDIDIMMKRSEYNQFQLYFQQEFSDKYEIVEPLSHPYFFSKMVKIYKKGTTYIEIPLAGVDGPNMIFVDLFLIENVPAPGIIRKLKARIYDFAFKGASVCLDYLYPSPVIEEKTKIDPEVRDYYVFRKRLGKIFSIFGGINFYLKLCDRVANQDKKTGWLGIPSGISYEKEIFPANVYEELTEIDFCGYKMSVPVDYDIYLRNLYGNYMEIPPKEKREFHVAYKIEF